MKHLSTLLAFGMATFANAQSIPNPGFESDCTFDLTGWSWFCSVYDAYFTDGHTSCYALALPTSDGSDPCFSQGELIGVHTAMVGLIAGVPYQLSLYVRMSNPSISSDCGLFAMPAGQPPTSFESVGVLIQACPVGVSNPDVWIQEIMNFTIDVQYAGMDFYYFIEYSAAPDLGPGLKFFDDITISDLSTGVDGTAIPSPTFHPNPATDKLWIELPDIPLSITAIDASGRAQALNGLLHSDQTFEVDVNSLPAGITLLRITTKSGTQNLRFIKM